MDDETKHEKLYAVSHPNDRCENNGHFNILTKTPEQISLYGDGWIPVVALSTRLLVMLIFFFDNLLSLSDWMETDDEQAFSDSASDSLV